MDYRFPSPPRTCNGPSENTKPCFVPGCPKCKQFHSTRGRGWGVFVHVAIMCSEFYPSGIDQEVEFHEIEIHFFMRSKLNSFMRLNLFINI